MAGLRSSTGNIYRKVHAGKLGNTWQLRLNPISIMIDMDGRQKKEKKTYPAGPQKYSKVVVMLGRVRRTLAMRQ